MRLTRKHAWAALIIIILLLILWSAWRHWEKITRLFGILFISAAIAYILTPLCDFLERRLPRTAAILIIIISVGMIISGFIFLFLPRIIKEALTLADRLPVIVKLIRNTAHSIQNHMESLGVPKGIQNAILTYMDTFQIEITNSLMGFLERSAGVISLLPSLFVELILGFYLLKDREYFGRVLINLIPLACRKRVLQTAAEINHILHNFIRGEVFIAGTVGILATLGYALIGLPYALILGFLAGLLEFIPYFGPWLGAVPALIIAWIAGSHKILWTLIVIILIQQLENIFITPKILGGAVNLHPVYIILSLWAGGVFFGVPGMFLAVPAVLILRIIIKYIYLSIVTIY